MHVNARARAEKPCGPTCWVLRWLGLFGRGKFVAQSDPLAVCSRTSRGGQAACLHPRSGPVQAGPSHCCGDATLLRGPGPILAATAAAVGTMHSVDENSRTAGACPIERNACACSLVTVRSSIYSLQACRIRSPPCPGSHGRPELSSWRSGGGRGHGLGLGGLDHRLRLRALRPEQQEDGPAQRNHIDEEHAELQRHEPTHDTREAQTGYSHACVSRRAAYRAALRTPTGRERVDTQRYTVPCANTADPSRRARMSSEAVGPHR
jgi:hypothetical protein